MLSATKQKNHTQKGESWAYSGCYQHICFNYVKMSKLWNWCLAYNSQNNGARHHKCIEVEYKSDYYKYIGTQITSLDALVLELWQFLWKFILIQALKIVFSQLIEGRCLGFYSGPF